MNTFSLERRHEPFDYVAQVSAAVHEFREKTSSGSVFTM